MKLGDGAWIGNDPNWPAVQLISLAVVNPDVSSHTTPAGDAGPATTQVVPPSVNRRPPVAGSTTCSSSGPQQNGPPPCVHEGTLATTRLLAPCQPTGHSEKDPDSLKRSK